MWVLADLTKSQARGNANLSKNTFSNLGAQDQIQRIVITWVLVYVMNLWSHALRIVDGYL